MATNSDCAGKCNAYAGCVGFTRDQTYGLCFVYTGPSQERQSNDCKSYTKCNASQATSSTTTTTIRATSTRSRTTSTTTTTIRATSTRFRTTSTTTASTTIRATSTM